MTAVRFVGEVLGLPKIGLSGLLDPASLRATLDRLIDWPALHRNVADGPLTSSPSRPAMPPTRAASYSSRAQRSDCCRHLGPIEYAGCELSGQHVRASSAIPVPFPRSESTGPPMLTAGTSTAVHASTPQSSPPWTSAWTCPGIQIPWGLRRLPVTLTRSRAKRRASELVLLWGGGGVGYGLTAAGLPAYSPCRRARFPHIAARIDHYQHLSKGKEQI